jgi:hypothetical protein
MENKNKLLLTPLHFDWHGINNEDGERIAKVSLKQYEDGEGGITEKFETYSRFFAAAPKMLSAIQFAIDEIEKWNHNQSHPLGDAFEKLAEAESSALGE